MLSSLFFHKEHMHALEGQYVITQVSTLKIIGSLCSDLIYFSFDQKREGNEPD